jgi:hypothetical protein
VASYYERDRRMDAEETCLVRSSARGRLSDVISDELGHETEIAATVDLAREDGPQWRTVA